MSVGVAAAQSAPEGIWARYVRGDLEAELVAELPAGVGNIAFSPLGAVVYSHHPFYGNPVKVTIINEDGQGFKPRPSTSWNTRQNDENSYLDTVLGIRGDADGPIWMSDIMHGDRGTPKLVGWNAVSNSLEAVLPIPAPATLPCDADNCASRLNGVVIDDSRGKFYFADEGIGPGGDASQAALVILGRDTCGARRVLEGHWSTPPADVPIVVDGQPLTFPNGESGAHTPILVGADGITADLDFEWLSFAPLNGGWVFRVLIDDLVNEDPSDEELGAKVEKYAVKPNAGGLSIDADNNLYFIAVESDYVGVIPQGTRRFRAFASHPDMQWPDGVSFCPDGQKYVSAAQLPQLPPFNDGVSYSKPPDLIFRFTPLAQGVAGR